MPLLLVSFLNVGVKQSRVKPLKIEEEKTLHVYYENKIQEVCGAFKFPHKIQVSLCVLWLMLGFKLL